jgi:hypothetical protein
MHTLRIEYQRKEEDMLNGKYPGRKDWETRGRRGFWQEICIALRKFQYTAELPHLLSLYPPIQVHPGSRKSFLILSNSTRSSCLHRKTGQQTNTNLTL